MKFVLRHGPREIPLPLGRFVIGRAENCELPLDDPLVSRRHVELEVAHGRRHRPRPRQPKRDPRQR